MDKAETRALILAPGGRDGALIIKLLGEAEIFGERVASASELLLQLQDGAGMAIVLEEALLDADLDALEQWRKAQPPWSDLPFLVLTRSLAGPVSNPRVSIFFDALGNVTLVERPLHPSTLSSAARTAVRARLRQYEARAHLAEIAHRATEIEDNERRLRAFADNMPALCWMAGADGYITWYNRRWYEYTGATPDGMAGWGWQSVHDPKILPQVMERWTASINSGESFEMTFPLRAGDGSYRSFLTRVAPLRDEHGLIQLWFGTNVDISQQLSAEAELRERETQLRFALEAGRLGAWELDLQSRNMRCSKQCNANYGLPADAIFGYDDLLCAIHPDDRERMQSVVKHAIDHVLPYEIEYRIHWPDGTEHWIEARGRIVERGDGARQLTGTTSDVSLRKRAESELLQMNERLEQRVADRTQQLEAAQQEWRRAEEQLRQSQKMEAIGQLTGGIAHDFNNLLTSIIGGLSVMERRLAEGRLDDVQRFLTTARNSAGTAATLTHRLLAFSRRQSLDPQPTSINELVVSFEDVFRRALGESIGYRQVLQADLNLARIDSNQLENALLNLVINARDAMPNGGEVQVATSNLVLKETARPGADDLKPGDYVCVSVRDSGSGMSADVIERAFEPFYTTKPIGQGTGLGLAMVYGFLKQSGGQVRIESQLGRGTEVRLLFPRVEESVALQSPVAPVEISHEQRGGTVLLVEDDVGVRQLLVELLQDLGYDLIEAGTGNEAVPVLESERQIHLLVTDVGLPGMNGRQLAEIARKLRPQLRVLFVTGYAQSALTRENFLAEGMDMIAKPFQLDDIASKIRSMIADVV